MRFTLALFMALFMVGCAKSPQQVPFQAQISTGGVQGSGESISLAIKDLRQSEVLGSRGGVYEGTSLITLQKGAIKDIEAFIKGRLEQAGFVFAEDIAANWSIKLDDLSYDVEKMSSVKEKVTVQCRMSIVITKGHSTFENSYSATSSEEVIGLATESKNVEIINRALNATLQSMLKDDEITRFMNE